MSPVNASQTHGAAPPRRYAIYARSAAGGDAALLRQVQAARAFLRQYGVAADEVPTYEDLGASSGSCPAPGLQALLRDVADGQVDAVVVHDLARLARGSNLPDLLTALDAWGVDVLVTTGDALPLRSPTTRLGGRLRAFASDDVDAPRGEG